MMISDEAWEGFGCLFILSLFFPPLFFIMIFIVMVVIAYWTVRIAYAFCKAADAETYCLYQGKEGLIGVLLKSADQ